ncbi:chorismate-binding protein [Pendulispora brunnea]|uniref:Chorismate-binding protein n=1 Tax=Pendulispora brunnea TaxID=2905690 RepID=A0ABZ2KD44_9BACT
MKSVTFDNPYPGMPIGAVGAAIARAFESRYPKSSGEFLSLFSYASPEGTRSIVGAGSEFHVEAVRMGDTLRIRLKHRAAVERESSYRLHGGDFHAEVFRHMAAFVDELRPFLTDHHGLPPSTPLLGGWRCGTHPESVEEPLVFTIPRIICQVSTDAIHFRFFESEECTDIDGDIVAFSQDPSPKVDLKVAKRKEIPGCREYVDTLVDLIAELSQEAMDKVVLCREVRLFLESEISPVQLLVLAASRTNARYEYVFRWGGGDAWIGISPEMLVKKEGERVVVEPLAGTRKGSHATGKSGRYRDELLNDSKEAEEHETAARMFYENLTTVCRPESIEQTESRGIIDLGYVQHLKSTITGSLETGMNVFHLLAAIYPPATIWGKPIALSGRRIRSHERIERDFFTGGLGFFTLEDDANFALAIRTARMSGNEVRVYAGSGIVKKSDPYREWLETTNKMQPFLE